MALQLEKQCKGVACVYHKIIKSEQEILFGKSKVQVGLYYNAAARAADIKNFLSMKEYTFNKVDMSLADIYVELKKDIYFKDAIDC